MSNITPEHVFKKYESGIDFNNRIGLYDTIKNNEDFFIGM